MTLTAPDLRGMSLQDLVAELERTLAAKDRARYDWSKNARADQLEPDEFLLWLINAGRGWGKTRTGAETARKRARRPGQQIAVIAKTHREVQNVCFDAPRAGLLAVIPPEEVHAYHRSTGGVQLKLKNGSTFYAFSAEDPDALRGYAFDFIWLDEYAAWPERSAQEVFDMCWFTMRESPEPGMVVTTTPKALPHVRALIEDCESTDGYVLTSGRTLDNAANLSPRLLAELLRKYTGTRLGRQELDAELLGDVEGALVALSNITADAVLPADVPGLALAVTAVDPATTSKKGSDETGIVTSGLSQHGEVYVLEDRSGRYPPDVWARTAWEQAITHGSAAVVVEDNAGGDMCEHTLNTAWQAIARDLVAVGKRVPHRPPIVRVTPSGADQSKWARAQPIGVLYADHRVHHVHDVRQVEEVTRTNGKVVEQPMLRALEDQLTTWDGRPGGKSPDRVDALVHGITWMLYPKRRASGARKAVAAPQGTRWSADHGR